MFNKILLFWYQSGFWNARRNNSPPDLDQNTAQRLNMWRSPVNNSSLDSDANKKGNVTVSSQWLSHYCLEGSKEIPDSFPGSPYVSGDTWTVSHNISVQLLPHLPGGRAAMLLVGSNRGRVVISTPLPPPPWAGHRARGSDWSLFACFSSIAEFPKHCWNSRACSTSLLCSFSGCYLPFITHQYLCSAHRADSGKAQCCLDLGSQ